jgi:hypothetical protein
LESITIRLKNLELKPGFLLFGQASRMILTILTLADLEIF